MSLLRLAAGALAVAVITPKSDSVTDLVPWPDAVKSDVVCIGISAQRPGEAPVVVETCSRPPLVLPAVR